MINHRTRLAALAVVVTAAVALPASAQAQSDTLRVFEHTDRLVLTQATGRSSATRRSRTPSPATGWTSTRGCSAETTPVTRSARSARTTSCARSATPEPDCISHVALGGSMLIFAGDPGTVVGGTGRYLHATGRVISSKEVKGGDDVVAKIRY
jgi:hypothetical protein